jgi:hypothetical protein
MYDKALLQDAEQDLWILYCFLEKNWISKPSDFDEIDPETKMGLIALLRIESDKMRKEESKMEAEQTKANMKARMGL